MNEYFWIDLAVTTILSALKSSIKNPASKARLRPVMLKLAATINVLWQDDDSFAEDLAGKTEFERVKNQMQMG